MFWQRKKTKAITVNGNVIAPTDKVLIYISRDLEPYRGFHSFCRALPKILRACPSLQVIVLGSSGPGYVNVAPPRPFDSWAAYCWSPVEQHLSPEEKARVHFLGKVSYQYYQPVLDISTVHCYLTYPFVISWSLVEAIARGCCIVTNDIAATREFLENDRNATFVDFFNYDSIADAIIELLNNPSLRGKYRSNCLSQSFLYRFEEYTYPRMKRILQV